ncbi:alpha/beta hydrolase [Thermomonas sp. HDW16]|uniref:alpha/beta hydrolase n=1 Tax=Thermomonas sp. HDW16 TaxID=2714945 RepID=UPI00140C3AFA|nr:alpha/beta hydrolase [Thermomonas sp. HDW16]QIL20553.1 alpha/beta hydrolase [Thermomonas sp. HDW16]
MQGSLALRAAATAVLALLATGCQRTAFLWANHGLPPPDTSIVYSQGSGVSLDVYRPTQPTDKPAPVLVFFYGGAWDSGRRQDYRFVGHRLAAAGIVTLVADYRTWPTVGFPGFVEDSAKAVAWAQKHAGDFGGDPARLFIAGHSAGAQIAALLGTDARYLRAQGMQLQDLAGVIGLSGPYDFDVTGDLIPIFGPATQWADAQAINFVDGDEPPFLLVHGDADQRVEALDSKLLASRLQAVGGSVRLLMLEGAGHIAPLAALYAPQREPRVLDEILRFIGTGKR